MFDVNEILARLQNGEDAQTIANEFANTVNQANKMYADQKAKEEAERKAKETAKIESLQAILNDLKDWFVKHYGMSEADLDIKAEDIIQMADEIVKISDGLNAVFGVPVAKKGKKPMKPANPDAIIENFLESMGW